MKVSDLFEVNYGHSLSLNKLRQTPYGTGVAFVSRTARNNGVSAWVEPIDGVKPLPAGLMTVCLRSRNHTLATFLQPQPFYCGYHISVLKPKKRMSDQEKLWWAHCIERNRYRYNFGRQANRSLKDLELPDAMPTWARRLKAPLVAALAAATPFPDVHGQAWAPFKLSDMFKLVRGRNVLKRVMKPGETAYVSASALNNGVSAWIDLEPDHPGGQITVCSNGSVGEAFFQPRPFIASGDVTVLVPRQEMSAAAALFVCSVIKAERYRYNYGRKWVTGRMSESRIQLPVRADGTPDWAFMEQSLRALPLATPMAI
ncbi:MAG: hypothetical protein JWL76_621 [Thermoleophilia bacterium]|nr:hypothetical protein [Thermoleophilia bacterium]